MSDEVSVWLSVWSEVHVVCMWSSWCHYHRATPSSLFAHMSLEVQTCFNFLLLAYAGCHENSCLFLRCWCEVNVMSVYLVITRCDRNWASELLWYCRREGHKGIWPAKDLHQLPLTVLFYSWWRYLSHVLTTEDHSVAPSTLICPFSYW